MDDKTPAAKPGTAAELAEMFASAQPIEVMVKRVTNEDGARKVAWEKRAIVPEALTIAQCGKVLQAMGPSLRDSTTLLDAAADHPDEIIAAVAIAIDWPTEEAGAIFHADFVTLIGAIYEANVDFFVRRLGPLVPELKTMMQAIAAMTGAGKTLSPTSGAGATRARKTTH